jgi:hypothetical protein
MKKLLVLLFPLLAMAQHPSDSDVKKLYTAFHDIDIDFLTERLCSSMSEPELYGKLDGYFLNDAQKFRYVQTNAKYNYGEAFTEGDVTYHPIQFRNVVRITFFKPIDVASTQAKLQSDFAAQSITYDKSRNAFLIVYQAKMLAYQQNGIWKFAMLDLTIPSEITAGCLPESVRNRLGF